MRLLKTLESARAVLYKKAAKESATWNATQIEKQDVEKEIEYLKSLQELTSNIRPEKFEITLTGGFGGYPKVANVRVWGLGAGSDPDYMEVRVMDTDDLFWLGFLKLVINRAELDDQSTEELLAETKESWCKAD